jgi:hypothetical protein
MPLALIFALVAAQGQAAVQATDFTQAYEILDPQRIALTPKVDGRIDEEEWDELGSAGPGKAYFEWQPGMIHAAATVPEGRDLLLSIDFRNNGWLIGGDNLEVRVSPGAEKPVLKARLLDATRVSGPAWVDLDGFELTSTVAARTEGGNTTYELTLLDPGIGLLPTDDQTKISIRADAPLATEGVFQPFVPRVLSPVVLGMQRSAGLPSGMRYNMEGAGKSVPPGEFMRLRLTFNGNNNMNLNMVSVRSEGLAKDGTTKLEVPFPKFDAKGRAFVDYSTTVATNVPLGYKVLRAELQSADGIKSLMEASYRIAPPMDFDLVFQKAPIGTMDRSQRYVFYVRSNGGRRIDGNMSIQVPAPMRILNQNSWKLQLAANQRSRYTFDMFIPANLAGAFPVTFKGTFNGMPYEQTEYITIGMPIG